TPLLRSLCSAAAAALRRSFGALTAWSAATLPSAAAASIASSGFPSFATSPSPSCAHATVAGSPERSRIVASSRLSVFSAMCGNLQESARGFELEGLVEGDRRHVDDVGDGRSESEDVDGAVHPEEDGPDGGGTAELAQELVADVPRGEVREDQHVGVPLD